jgi:hypothetical protein
MKSIFVVCLGVAALAASSTASQAAGGCGRGSYYDGYRCVPMGYGGYDPGHPYGYNYDYGDPRCGAPNFTIQNGVCKPYTGR